MPVGKEVWQATPGIVSADLNYFLRTSQTHLYFSP
jgi:hypothetical protein